jgi:hypothetical protein
MGIRTAPKTFVNVPNASNVFSDLVGICRLKLRQLRVSLDFEEDFLSGGRQNLQTQHPQRKRREIEAEIFSIHRSDRATDMSKERGGTLMLIGAEPSSCLGTGSLPCSVSDMMRSLSVEVDEFKYQETPSAAAMVAEGEGLIGLRVTSSEG